MPQIKSNYFHIKGKQLNTTNDQNVTDNYILASLDYTKGIGYTWSIRPIGQYTVYTEDGDFLMNRLTVYILKDNKEIYKECLVGCKRSGKAKQKEAEELYDSNVISAITNRLGYEID